VTPDALTAKATPIKLLLFDVDGVMTDGSVLIHGDGTESKRFHIRDGVASKIDTYDQIVGDMVLTDDQVAYMGDDIVDLAVLARVGLASAPADATAEVRAIADFVSAYRGGEGAVRELIELVLRAQGLWESIVAAYEAEGRA
jgi:3-deoxy-D-manno-octulosonate 8-phosphate phosphatase (KDO 8-P phosphatase)